MEANQMASTKATQIQHNDYSDVFAWIRCYKGTFPLWIKDDMKLYHVLPRHVPCTLKEPLRKEQKTKRTTDIGATRGRWNNRMVQLFFIVPKSNDTVHLCLDPMRLNQAIIWPVKLTKLTDPFYITLIYMQRLIICMSVWQVQIQTTVWSCTSRWYVPAKRWDIQKHTKYIWHCGWHFNCRVVCRWQRLG